MFVDIARNGRIRNPAGSMTLQGRFASVERFPFASSEVRKKICSFWTKAPL